MSVQFLLDLGFEPVGEWSFGAETLDFQLQKYHQTRKILYAFVVGEQVMYIGKSIRSLGQRMYGYKRPGPSQRTNIANNILLKEILARGNSVSILVFVQSEPIFYRGVQINLAAGLEDELIERLNPPWNKNGRG